MSWIVTIVLLLFSAQQVAAWDATKPIGSGCDVVKLQDKEALSELINREGLKEFRNPIEVRPVSEEARLDLVVAYATVQVAGCTALLRTYNGSKVGPTIRAKPGDTLHIRLINKLPPGTNKPPQQPTSAEHSNHFSFNITNLHTHGLHVAPQGPGPIDPKTGRVPFESDNVLLELQPGEEQDYRIEIPDDHPAGTYWYHAHVHGSTTIQVGSGMAGALIIDTGTADNGDLDTIPVIGKARSQEKIFVLQQIGVDENGQIENIPKPQGPTLVNGQLVPVIKMRPGELQRWRFIHAGVHENIALAVDGHALHEVATDGISLGRIATWPEAPASGVAGITTLIIGPGYRTDVLIQAKSSELGKRYFLRDLQLKPALSIQASARAVARAEKHFAVAAEKGLAAGPQAMFLEPDDLTPGQILAEIVVEGDPLAMALPSGPALAEVVPKELPSITQAEIEETRQIDPSSFQSAHLSKGFAICNPDTGKCDECVPGQPGCVPLVRFMVNDFQFSLDKMNTRTLKLRTGGKWTAAEWHLTGERSPHVFHIHINPFQVLRLEPNELGGVVRRWVWKDTIIVTNDDLPRLRTRYTKFTGKFVLHCHILSHEDKGMMQLVEIVD